MIHRLSEIIPHLIASCRERGWLARRGERAWLEVVAEGEPFVIDAKEHTGPIYWPNLEGWMALFPASSHLILLTMGFLPTRTLGQLLGQPGLAGRVELVELGLRSFFDTEFRPRKFGQTETALYRVVEGALAQWAVEPQAITCRYCSGKPLAACEACGHLICKSHFIPCPLCRACLCHPDASDCYFEHEC